MTGFFIAAALLLAAGIASLLWPLLRGGNGSSTASAAAVVSLFRERLRELDAEHATGGLDEAQYQQNRRDIERGLLDAVSSDPAPASGPRRARWTAAALGVFLLISPVVLYVNLGNPDGLLPGAAAPATAESGSGAPQGSKGAARPLTDAQVQKMIAGLQEALKKNPADPQGWSMLARAYAYQHQYEDAVRAYTRAIALTPSDARLLADLADAMAMTNGQRLDGEPLKLIERALQIDPHEIKALALAGTAAFDHQQYAKAVDYWERALAAAPNDPEFAKTLRGSLEEARQLAGGKGGASGGSAAAPGTSSPANAAGAPARPGSIAGAGSGANAGAAAARPPMGKSVAADSAGPVRGRVVLSPALAAKAAPGDTVFVFARAAQGPRVPLALVRRQVKDLPFEFSLDDSMAMMPDFTMSKYAPVIISARISKSGDAIAAPGDLQGSSKPVPLGTSGLTITIDQVVP